MFEFSSPSRWQIPGKEEHLDDYRGEMDVKQFGRREIIDDYMKQLEEQERQMDKQTLLRVIKHK